MATFQERIDRYRQALKPGTVIRCTGNARIPTRVGVELAVVKVGKSYLTGTVLADPSGHLDLGATFWCNLPTRASDLVAVDEAGILYKLQPDGALCSWEVA